MQLSEFPIQAFRASHIEQLRVPVRRTLVEVHTARERRRGFIFLPAESCPEDLFEDEAPFFPAEENGKIRLYARASVVSLVVDETDAAPGSLAQLGLVYESRPLAVHLRGGQCLTGVLMSSSRPSRTLDLVNQRARSIALHAHGKVHHVAKAHIECIEELP